MIWPSRLSAWIGITLLGLSSVSCSSASKTSAPPPDSAADLDGLDNVLEGQAPPDLNQLQGPACLKGARYPFRIDSISPGEGSRDKPNLLTIEGRGFTDGGELKIGSVNCEEVKFISPKRLTCRYVASESNEAAALDVLIVNPDGYCALLTSAFRFVSNVVISPRIQTVSVEKEIHFSARGGAKPYRYGVSQGAGTIDAKDGVYRAPTEQGSSVISVTDAAGVSADALVLIVPKLSILPERGEMNPGESFRLGASGGVQPYRYAVVSGPGEVDAETGAFTSAQGGETLVAVTDAEESSAQAKIITQPNLLISPPLVEIATTNLREFKAAGGVPPYTFELRAGVGSVLGNGADRATYAAGDQPGDAAIRVIDSRGAKADARVVIRPPLISHPQSRTVLAGESVPFLVTGGVPEHSIEKMKGDGRIDEGAVYVAPKRASEDLIEVRDSAGNKIEVTLSVIGAGSTPANLAAASLNASGGISSEGLMINAVFSRRIAGGFGHTCAVLGESLKCWGTNKYGQLGNGSTKSSLRPVDPEGLQSGVMAVVTGFYHSCALLAGGSVRCWGDNRYGQLGDNTVESSNVPEPVFGLTSGVRAISAGQFHTCALKGTSVICWGDNRRGQLGDGTRVSSAVPLIPSGMGAGVTSIGAGSHHTCALKDADVFCWGYNRSGQLGTGLIKESFVPVQVQKLESGERKPLAVDAKGSHSCALFGASLGVNTQMKCWGYNGPGNLGDRSTEFRYVPQVVAELSEGVTSMALGYTHTCAVLKNGAAAKCWGQNVQGQLGDGTATQYRFVPIPVSALPEGIVAITAGVGHSCALYADGVWCWGSNARGQFGNGSMKSSATPKKSFKVKVN